MKQYLMTTAAAFGLALAGCGSEDVENTAIDDIDEIVDADQAEDDEGYPVAGNLTEEQQARFNEFDREAAAREFDANQETLAREGSGDSSGNAMTANDGGAETAADAQGSSTARSDVGTSSATNSSTSSSRNVAPLRPRSAMDFEFLDRNGDGQLSVAEYAIWAVRSNPRRPKPNDNTRPYTSEDQINEAGETFFYFDENGDTYLSPSEFAAARASARTPS